MTREEFCNEWSKLHGGAAVTGVVRGWLNISYLISRPLARLSPNLVTLAAFAPAILYLYFIHTPLAFIFLALSLLFDGIDGTIAILGGRITKFGGALDAVVDRVIEALWAIGLVQLGAPFALVIAAWLLSYLQEYARARGMGLGVSDVGVVTIAERPVRATIIFIALVAISLGLVSQKIGATAAASIWCGMQAIALFTVLRFLRSHLRRSQR